MLKKRMNKMLLSVVIPVFNEQDNLIPLYQEIKLALKEKEYTYEIIFINDGSTDRSLAVLTDLCQKDDKVKLIDFRRNFGQSAAISAGFDRCKGDIVVTLDADLQNDPADIPKIVDKVNEGYDIVNGWRKKRQDRLISRKIPSIIGNKLISFITKVKLHDYGCTLRGFRREIVKNLKLYSEMHRYIPALASRFGIKSIEIPVNHRPRKHGQSKYGLGRTLRVILDLISLKYLLSYSHRPLQIFGGLGIMMMGLGFLSGLYLTFLKYYQNVSINRPLLFLTILLLFLGFQMISLGLVAEMLSRIYHIGLNQNVYTIRQTIGFGDENIDDRPRALF